MRHALPVLFLLAVGSANAALVEYDESLAGDISGTPAFHLDTAGTNSWTGTTSWSDGNTFDHDSFYITLAEGLQITEYFITWINPSASGFDSSTATFDFLFIDDGVLKQWDSVNVNSGETSITTGPLVTPYDPTGPTTLSFSAKRPSIIPDGWSMEVDYTIVVTTVPVPAAFWLFGSALAGLGWIRRKQAAQH